MCQPVLLWWDPNANPLRIGIDDSDVFWTDIYFFCNRSRIKTLDISENEILMTRSQRFSHMKNWPRWSFRCKSS